MKATNEARVKDLLDLPPIKRPSKKILAQLHAMKRLKGKIAAIDPETGDYFIDDRLTGAFKKARQKHPGQTFYFIRIGYNFVHEHKGGIKKYEQAPDRRH